MLRALVIVLLLANLGFCAWTQGWLDNLIGVRARSDREPERLLRQVRPETVQIVAPPGRAASEPVAAAALPAPLVCLEAGPFDASQLLAAEAAIRSAQPAFPEGSWVDQKIVQPASWLVYMGRYAGSDALARKEDELKRRNLDYEEVHLAGLEPGLSLGRFDDKPAADQALAAFAAQGLRTARVVKAGEATTTHLLRFEGADPALAARLTGLQDGSAGGATAAVRHNRQGGAPTRVPPVPPADRRSPAPS